MSSERRDVNRLFKHFGLDPADYTHFNDKMLSAASAASREAPAATQSQVRSDATVPRSTVVR